MNKKKIYILLTYTGTVLSRGIRLVTGEPYSHVSLVLDDDLEEIYSFGRLDPNNPFFAGFVREDMFNKIYRKFPNTSCALYSLEIQPEAYEKIRLEIDKFKAAKELYNYNLLGLIFVKLRLPVDRRFKYFCSQFVSKVLRHAGIEISEKPESLIEPRDFRTCQYLELVYEGDLGDLKILNQDIA